MNCLKCGQNFTPKRKKSRYCSTKCRMAAFRSIVTESIVTGIVTSIVTSPKNSCSVCHRPFMEILEQWVDKPNPKVAALLTVCISCSRNSVNTGKTATNEPISHRKSGHYLKCGNPRCYATFQALECHIPNWTRHYESKPLALVDRAIRGKR